MCVGTEELQLASNDPVLPNPVVPGIYPTPGSTQFSVTTVDSVIVVLVTNITELPSVQPISFNCTSLESSATARLLITNENVVVVSLFENVTVLYGEQLNILYTVATSSNGSDNIFNEPFDLFLEFENPMTIEPVELNISLLQPVVSGNLYQFTIPFAAANTSGTFTLIAEAFDGELSDSASISVTTILPTISAVTAVYELVGRLVMLECNLSFSGSSIIPSVPVTWYQRNGEGFTDASQLDNVQLLSQGSRHTLLFESVTLNDASTYVCAIVEGQRMIVEESIDLFVFENEINIGYDNNRLIPSGNIINRLNPSPAKRNALPSESNGVLTLDCVTVTGQENPYWELSNNVLFNGTITTNDNVTLTIGDQPITIYAVSVSAYITVISFDTIPFQLSGTYTCRSSPSGPSSSVYITPNNPVVRSLVSSPLKVPQCGIAELSFQVAYFSDGTPGSNAIETVRLEQFRNGFSLANFSLSNNNQQVYFIQLNALSSSSGNYFAYVPVEPEERDFIELVILYPAVTMLTGKDVVLLSGKNITLGCIPSNQTSEVRWIFYRNDGTSEVLSPSGGDDVQKRVVQDMQAVFDPPGLYHRVTLINTTLDNTGIYSCEVVPVCDDSFAIANNVTLTVVPEEVNIGYDSNRLLSSGTIINNFATLDNLDDTTSPTPPPSLKRNIEPHNILQLECITVMGQENPYWELSDNAIFNGTIAPNLTLQIGELQATIFIINASSYRTVIIFDDFFPQLSGKYTCRSTSIGPSSSVLLTTRNPFVRILTPRSLGIFQCQVATVMFQAVLNSDGLLNQVETVVFEQFQNGSSVGIRSYSLQPLQLSLQTFQINFTATSSQEGKYYIYFLIDPLQRDFFELLVQYPTLSLLTDNNITTLRGNDVIFRCVPSVMNFSVRWRFYGADGTTALISQSIQSDDMLSKRQTSAPGFTFELTPPGLFYNLILYNIPQSANGIFSCEIAPPCADDIIIAQNTTLTVQPACDEIFEVVLWPKTAVSGVAMIRCADIHSSFRFGPYITRMCWAGERWGPIDFSQCTVKDGSAPLLTVSVVLQGRGEILETPNATIIQNQVVQDTDFGVEEVSVTVRMFEEGLDEYPVYIFIELPIDPVNETEIGLLASYFNSRAVYGIFRTSIVVVTVFVPNDVCFCDVPMLISDSSGDSDDPMTRQTRQLYDILDVCIGPAVSPCMCNATSCWCNDPAYSGNGTVCARDSDGDTLPDVELGCDEIFCQKDACPLMQSLLSGGDQDASICAPPMEGQLSCAEETDEFSITWLATAADTNVTMACIGGTGIAIRYCDSSGNWELSNVAACRSYEYIVVAGQAQALSALSTASPELVAEMSTDITETLIAITEPVENTSSLPLDLGTVVDVLSSVISTANVSGAIEQEEFVNNVLEVYNNVLNTSNTPGWTELQEIDRTQSQQLLLNAEQFSAQWANTLNVSENRTIVAENIVISAEAVDVSEDQSTSDVMWPTPDIIEQAEIFKGSSPFAASVMIPADLIRRRGLASVNNVVLVANTAYRNFASLLPRSVNVTRRRNDVTTQAVSMILSSQVIAIGSSVSVPATDDEPVVLMFGFSKNDSDPDVRCGFWDFDLDQGSGVPPGGWSSDGLRVVDPVDLDNNTIVCSSSHLTSFAVLVDVSGATQDVSESQRRVLSAVSYIGASISLVCLIIAIILFIVYRKSLLKGIHNFIHLNLSIALAIALLVFLIGIETATGSDGGCVFVAFLLHYFFTTVFTWMLCEGIMLYFLLVKVFNTGVGQRKLFYLAMGWGIPIPIVVIAVGIAHDQYGTDEYCWISTDEGAIWAFVAPMLVIILANICFLGLALHSIYRSKRSSLSADETSNVTIVKTILKATVVLLPLLGVTWVFGILAVNEESIAFAWIFTLLNSFQGVFILVLHVLRNEKIKARIKTFFRSTGKYSIATSGDSTTSSRFRTTKSNKAFTVKVTARTDDEVELGTTKKVPLDDSTAEPSFYVNPEVSVAADDEKKPLAFDDEEAVEKTKETST